MIQLFRQNNFLTSLLLIPYTFIVRLGYFWLDKQPIQLSTDGVLYSIFLKAFGNHYLLQWIVTNFIIAFTAVLMNRLLIKHRINRDQTLIPGLLFILFSSWIEIFIPFSAIHIANYFLALSFLSLFSYTKKKPFTSSTFDGSMYLSISILFYTPYILFAIPIILGFFSLDRVKINDFLSILVGLLTPFLMLSGILYVLQSSVSLFQGFDFGIRLPKLLDSWTLLEYVKIGVYIIALVICSFSYVTLVKKNNIQVQKKFRILYWILICATLGFVFILNKNNNHLLIFSLPFGYILGLLWTRTRRVLLEEVLHVMFIVAIIYLQINPTLKF